MTEVELRMHKIFAHISEFPEIDPSVGIEMNEEDFISEMEKNESELFAEG